jgi:hypothetical protein
MWAGRPPRPETILSPSHRDSRTPNAVFCSTRQKPRPEVQGPWPVCLGRAMQTEHLNTWAICVSGTVCTQAYVRVWIWADVAQVNWRCSCQVAGLGSGPKPPLPAPWFCCWKKLSTMPGFHIALSDDRETRPRALVTESRKRLFFWTPVFCDLLKRNITPGPTAVLPEQ